ncbi:hypothetical protein E6H31_00475 [Candidatus Bathyarchaeota archaeon]|nr:MAG: hypothetical protein E6H31_00475 [Candidatus Bathyarchaeota archaeon]
MGRLKTYVPDSTLEEIRRLYEGGESIRDLAKRFKLSNNIIWTRLREMKARRRTGEATEQDQEEEQDAHQEPAQSEPTALAKDETEESEELEPPISDLIFSSGKHLLLQLYDLFQDYQYNAREYAKRGDAEKSRYYEQRAREAGSLFQRLMDERVARDRAAYEREYNLAAIDGRETPAPALIHATPEYDAELQRKRLAEAREAEENRRERIRTTTSAAIQGYGHKAKQLSSIL